MSVRKRVWKTSAGEVRQAWLCDYTGQSGKRHVKTFARKKDADAFIAKAKVEVREGVHTADSDSVTIRDAAALWLTTGAARGLERATLASYEQQARLHIIPMLGGIKLSRLSAPAIRDFEDRLRMDGRSYTMIRKVLSSLGSMLSDAQERGLVARNVVRDLGSRRKKGAERRADKRAKGHLKVGVDIPGREEIRAFVGALREPWRPILLTATFTGLRASELRGLRWADVDFKGNQLHVRQRADRYNVIGQPKSLSGERTVPLPPIVANALRELKLARCGIISREDIVFVSGRGHIRSHSNIIRHGLCPAQIAAGVTKPDGTAKYTGLHSLRHFYASFCINRKEDGGLGLPLKLVQARLGHTTLAMTADTYGHLFPSGDDGSELAAAEKSLLG